MCGLAGFLTPGGGEREAMRAATRSMTDAIIHRGPDGSGEWVDADAGIALGHRRLAIIDLTPQGHQPMVSHSGRYVIAFNGEIYNYPRLREEIEANTAVSWRGRSDTEVLLAALDRWGIDKALTRLVGMFAFAVWDREQQALILARDRMGEKPLYYGWQGRSLLFGSELKALKAHPRWQGRIHRDVLTLYLRHNYIPAPYSIFQGISKLMPGTLLKITREVVPAELPEPTLYWDARAVAEQGVMDPLKMNEQEVVSGLDNLLRKTIRDKMISDVPLGAFLSGGYDSSMVVALMQAESNSPVKTFSIGFDEEGYDEARHAKAVARHLGTDHTEMYVQPDQALEVIPRLPFLYDEPFSDSSQIPTFLVSQMTRQHVTVALSGDGGDELFYGYPRYQTTDQLWRKIGSLPRPLRLVAAKLIRSTPVGLLDHALGFLTSMTSRYGREGAVGDKLHKAADLLDMKGGEDLYLRLISHWKQSSRIVSGATEPASALTDRKRWANLPDLQQRIQFLDLISYLPDDILVKVDRAAMGVSLETRVPFLDHRVVEFAWRIPLSMKLKDGKGKWVLRQVLNRYVPRSLTDRPKMGFGVPIEHWLRGPLRDWAEELLAERRLQDEGFFHPAPIRAKWEEHLAGKRNWSYYIWDILMFQAWFEKNG